MTPENDKELRDWVEQGVLKAMTEEQKLAISERQEYEAATREERKPYHNISAFIKAKYPERSSAGISIRSKLHLAGDRASIFWERIDDGMPLATAANLMRDSEKAWAQKSNKERGSDEKERLASFTKVAVERLERYDAQGMVRTMNGKMYRSMPPTDRAIRIAKGEAAPRGHGKGSPSTKKNKEAVLTQHKTIVRESIAAWIAARLPKGDSRVPALTMEFMREIEVVLTSFTQRLSMSKPNRDQLFSACDLLNIPRPRWGKPADQKRAWKNRRAVLKSTHPDTLGHEGGLGAYHGITEAYNIVVAYNDSLNPNPTNEKTGESNEPPAS